ncbi:MAG: hypothetical protein WC707_03175 [Candidatus Babeliaceae bacterium]
MFKQLVLIAAITHTCMSAHSPLMQAVEDQDFKKIEALSKNTILTATEKAQLIQKAQAIAEDCEHNAWLSSESKKALLAVACVCLIGIGLAFLGQGSQIIMLYDRIKEISFWQEIIKLSTEYKYYFAACFLGAGVSFAAAIVCGAENMSGYYTDRHNYIRNYIRNL